MVDSVPEFVVVSDVVIALDDVVTDVVITLDDVVSDPSVVVSDPQEGVRP